jgi:hypothetical protein
MARRDGFSLSPKAAKTLIAVRAARNPMIPKRFI